MKDYCQKHNVFALDGRCLVCELETLNVDNPILYAPVFAGKDAEGTKIVMYRARDESLHIKINNGPLLALSPGGEYVVYEDRRREYRELRLSSKEWTGRASGNVYDLLDELPIREREE